MLERQARSVAVIDVVGDDQLVVGEPDVELERARRAREQPPQRQRVVAAVRRDLERHGNQVRRCHLVSVSQDG